MPGPTGQVGSYRDGDVRPVPELEPHFRAGIGSGRWFEVRREAPHRTEQPRYRIERVRDEEVEDAAVGFPLPGALVRPINERLEAPADEDLAHASELTALDDLARF